MIRTITLGNHILIQGKFVGSAKDGRIIIDVDGRTFEGQPVTKAA